MFRSGRWLSQVPISLNLFRSVLTTQLQPRLRTQETYIVAIAAVRSRVCLRCYTYPNLSADFKMPHAYQCQVLDAKQP